MTKPIQQRTYDNLLNEAFSRIRVLEALPTGSLNQVLTSNKYTVHGPEWQSLTDPVSLFNQNGVTPVLDATAPYTGYLEYNGSDGSFVVVGMPLYPRYSAWVVTVWYERGPSAGILEFQWATATVDEYADNAIGSSASIARPPADIPADWFVVGGATSNYQLDMYNAGASWVYAKRSDFVIVGDDGVQLSADGTVPSTTGMDWTAGNTRAFDAGGDPSLYWYLRLYINGKNPSSSSYDCKLAGVTVSRYTGEQNTVT